MRDPQRIEPFLKELGKYWSKVPDWRFGQLICNVFGEIAVKRDPFFIEEGEMLSIFAEYFREGDEKTNEEEA